jgi:hypothetical protein
MDKKFRKWMIIEIVTISTYILTTSFYYHLDKYTTGLPFVILTLLIPVTLISIIVFLLKAGFQIIRNRQKSSYQLFLLAVIPFITLIYVFICPNFNSESLESKTILRACYEGTQNQSTLIFKENKTFELHSTGVFFSSKWFYGTFEQKADTFFLHYKTEKPRRVGTILVIVDENLITIDKDTSQIYLPFYLGYCKGLN